MQKAAMPVRLDRSSADFDQRFAAFLAAKREEWFSYIKHVSPWEIDRYLGMY